MRLQRAVGDSSVSRGIKYLSSVTATSALPDLLHTDAEELVAGLECGRYTSVDLVKVRFGSATANNHNNNFAFKAYIARIQEVQPTLKVVTEINPDAISIAQKLDHERATGSVRGPLHGIPLLIKNNIATMDQMDNTAGSLSLLGSKVPHDIGMAAKLRAAGVIILGKANLSQWANFRSSDSSSGWSAYGGQVLGAFGLDALIMPTDFSPVFPAQAGLPVVTVPMGFYPRNRLVLRLISLRLVRTFHSASRSSVPSGARRS